MMVMEKKEKYITARNGLDIAPQALILAAGVVLSVVLVSIMVTQFRQSEGMANIVSNEIVSRTEDIMNNEIMQYDGLTVKGADVINFYKKHLGSYMSGEDAGITVVISHASGGSSFSYSDGGAIEAIRDSESPQYVKPTSQYKCKVEKNKNGIITKIIFTQK